MNIRIIAVGKIKEKYLQKGIQEYIKRLSRYCSIEIIEVSDEKAPETLSPTEENIVKQKEGERILKAIRKDAYKIALAIEGQAMTSEEFAAKLVQLKAQGKDSIDFIIGGSLGLDNNILKQSDMLYHFQINFSSSKTRLILTDISDISIKQ